MRPYESSHHTGNAPPSRGFSLLEVTVTLCLLSLLMASAVPSISRASRRLQLASEATSLRLFFERMYAHSLAYQDRITIRLSETHATAYTGDEKRISDHSLHHSVSIVLPARGELTLQVYPTISVSPATVKLRLGAELCDLIISLRGRARTTC